MMATDTQALLQEPLPRATDALGREGLMESVSPSHEGNDCPDITRQPLELPADRFRGPRRAPAIHGPCR